MRLRENILLIGKVLLTAPDPMNSTHSTHLAPYYSSTSLDSLLKWLIDLSNTILAADAGNSDAKKVIENFVEWTDDLWRAQEELFNLAIEKRSQFTFDIIHWISQIVKIMLALCNAPACDARARKKLIDHADKLVRVLTRIPINQNCLEFCENWGLGGQLFEIASEALSREIPDISERASGALLDWGFREASQPTGRAIIEHAIEGSVPLALALGEANELKAHITLRLQRVQNPDRAFLDRVARNLRRTAATLRVNEFELSAIQRALQSANPEETRALLNDIANILSPETADEPLDLHCF
jgi:hypothetical protein